MASVIHLDTHVVVWLYTSDERKLRSVRKTINRNDLEISAAVLLELQFLYEIGKAAKPAETVHSELLEQFGIRLSGTPFPQVVRHAMSFSWTRDPFDRLIVGNAEADGVQLLTRDEHLRKHWPRAVWR
jgi:PIN domain nuclease of toxin-antitoxin system